MVTECKQFLALSSEPSMSGINANLPCATLPNFSGLGMSLNSISNNLSTSPKGDKKVEVRWLESEADMYLKQWQRRYCQLEGSDGNHPRWRKGYLLEQNDDWNLTARSILDLDVECMSSKDYNKFNLENYNPSFDFFLSHDKQQDFLFSMDDSLEDNGYGFEGEIVPMHTITLDTNNEMNQELIAALKSNNLVFKNGKLEYSSKKGKNSEKEKPLSEKQSKKAQKATIAIESTISAVAEESASSVPSSDTSPSKSSTKSPRKTNAAAVAAAAAAKQQRTRPPSTRRQMYICEYPGCSYQSDRNFNFLRHKRTHGKQKNDENKKHHSGISTTSELMYAASKASTLNDSSYLGLEMGSSASDIMHLSSQSPLLHTELNLNLAQCNSIGLAENDQSFSLTNDDFMERQSIIMKDINNLEHVLADNHFSSLALEQPFLS